MTDGFENLDPDQIFSLWRNGEFGFNKEMNPIPVKIDANGVLLRMPFNEQFCADEEGGLLHGGVLAALLDASFGLSALLLVKGLQSLATLDLRVEYLRPAKSRSDVMVFAECYRQTRHVVFNRGRIWFSDDDAGDVAAGYATFAITRSSGDQMYKTGDGQ